MTDRLREMAFIVVTHRFVTSAPDDLRTYLVKNSASVLYIWHSFSDAKDRKSFCELHERGKKTKYWETADYRFLPEFLVYLKEVLHSMLWILRSRKRWDVYIGADGFCSLIGVLCRRLCLVAKVVYWAIDFVPTNRFGNRIKDAAYRTVNCLSLKHVDRAWNLSPRIAEGRARLYERKSAGFAEQIVVPLGVWTARRRTQRLDEVDRYSLVFLGHLLEKQGVQLVLEAIPDIIAEIPDFRFVVIGTGRYEEALRRKAVQKGVQEYVHFVGMIESHERVEQLLSECACAVAPYNSEKDTWTLYADPGKVKNYLASGLPVILTDVPYNARRIEAEGCGVVVAYEKKALTNAIIDILTDERKLEKYRCNALRYSKTFDWNAIFDVALSELLGGESASAASPPANQV